jgi:hypothetical protein
MTKFTKRQLRAKTKKQLQTLCKKHKIAIPIKKKNSKKRKLLNKDALIQKLHSANIPTQIEVSPAKVTKRKQKREKNKAFREASWKDLLLDIVKEKGIVRMIDSYKSQMDIKMWRIGYMHEDFWGEGWVDEYMNLDEEHKPTGKFLEFLVDKVCEKDPTLPRDSPFW